MYSPASGEPVMAASCESGCCCGRWRSQSRNQSRRGARTVAGRRRVRARRCGTQAGHRTACMPSRARRSTHGRPRGSGRRSEQAARAVGPLWLAALFGAVWSCRRHTCKPPPFGGFRHAAVSLGSRALPAPITWLSGCVGTLAAETRRGVRAWSIISSRVQIASGWPSSSLELNLRRFAVLRVASRPSRRAISFERARRAGRC